MVAGKNAQTAGIHRQRLVQPKLKREIRNLLALQVGVGAFEPGVFAFHVLVKRPHHAVVAVHVVAVVGDRIEARAFHLA